MNSEAWYTSSAAIMINDSQISALLWSVELFSRFASLGLFKDLRISYALGQIYPWVLWAQPWFPRAIIVWSQSDRLRNQFRWILLSYNWGSFVSCICNIFFFSPLWWLWASSCSMWIHTFTFGLSIHLNKSNLYWRHLPKSLYRI